MRRSLHTLLVLFLLQTPMASPVASDGAEHIQPAGNPLYLAVTRRVFVTALDEWVAYRRNEGYDVRVGVLDDFAGLGDYASGDVANWLADEARLAGRPPDYILLVGDVGKGTPWHVPTLRRPLHRWGSDQKPFFASDAAYGDLDGDGLPDIPVGRMPVRTVGELKLQIEKIRRYEVRNPGLMDLRIVGWQGTAGYGKAEDFVATLLVSRILGSKLPPAFNAWIICSHPQSPYCGYPPDQPELFVDAMRRGSAVSLMIAHGLPQSANGMFYRWRQVNLEMDHARSMQGEIPASPLVLITCSSGAFDMPDNRCLAEEFLLQPGGPIVTCAASTKSNEMPNYFSAVALVAALDAPEQTFGCWWLALQRKAFRTRDFLMEPILLQRAGAPDKKIDTAGCGEISCSCTICWAIRLAEGHARHRSMSQSCAEVGM